MHVVKKTVNKNTKIILRDFIVFVDIGNGIIKYSKMIWFVLIFCMFYFCGFVGGLHV